MVRLTSYEDCFYHPPDWPGLEEVIRFPDGEVRQNSLPNSTVWVFNAANHVYRPEILGSDAGCGMAGFIVADIDHREAADRFYTFLRDTFLKGRRNRRSIGGGNHFIDICAPIDSIADLHQEPYKIILIHTHGPDKSLPTTIEEAQRKQQQAATFRRELGKELSALVESPSKLMGDWTHNSIALEDQKVVYRKGVVKAEEEKIHFLPAHLGAKILLYTLNSQNPPPYSSLPHATGRRGPLGSTKVSREEAEKLRQMVYIPKEISSASLRSEHPSCYNGHEKIIRKLRQENNFFIPLGETRILSYVGKV